MTMLCFFQALKEEQMRKYPKETKPKVLCKPKGKPRRNHTISVQQHPMGVNFSPIRGNSPQNGMCFSPPVLELMDNDGIQTRT